MTQINFMSVVITCKSNIKIVFRDLCGSRTIGSSSSSNGARRRSRRYPDSPDLGHVLYFSTNGEAHQVSDCNVVLRLMKTGWRHRKTWTLSTPKPQEGLVWVEVCSCVPSPELVQPKRRKNSSRPAGTPYVSKCGLSSQSQGGVWATFLLILSEDKKNSECSIINHHPWLSLHVSGDTHKIFFNMITDEFL